MITCQVCGKANRDGKRFCSFCGRSLSTTIRCPSCGEDNPGDARFCDGCGTPIGPHSAPAVVVQPPSAAPAPPSERSPLDGEPGVPAAVEPDTADRAADLTLIPPLAPAEGFQPAREDGPAIALPPTVGVGELEKVAGGPGPGLGEQPTQPTSDADRRDSPLFELPAGAARVEPIAPEDTPHDDGDESAAGVPVEDVAAPADEPPTAQRELVRARSLAGGRPRMVAAPPTESLLEAGRAFAAVAADVAAPTKPARPAVRAGIRLLTLALALAVTILAAVALRDDLPSDLTRVVPDASAWVSAALNAGPSALTANAGAGEQEQRNTAVGGQR